jgi:4-oxalocrotonate tautomerase family enzyme
MPVVIVEWWEGRTAEQKRKVIAGITEVLNGVGIPPEATQVIIKDNPKVNWGTAGKPCSDK